MTVRMVSRSGRYLALGVLSLTALSACVSPRDIRVLQQQLDDMQAEQKRMSKDLHRLDSLATEGAGDTREMAVDLKHSVADLQDQMVQMDARLADLDQRLASGAGGSSPQVIVPAATSAAMGGMTASGGEDLARETYQDAFDALKRDEHEAAIVGFRAYLDMAPDAPEAASAAYWIGESFYAQGMMDSALAQFQLVLDMYPASAKVPAALFKSGNIYEEEGDKAAAYPYYRRLKEEFPQSLEYQQLRRQLEE